MHLWPQGVFDVTINLDTRRSTTVHSVGWLPAHSAFSFLLCQSQCDSRRRVNAKESLKQRGETGNGITTSESSVLRSSTTGLGFKIVCTPRWTFHKHAKHGHRLKCSWTDDSVLTKMHSPANFWCFRIHFQFYSSWHHKSDQLCVNCTSQFIAIGDFWRQFPPYQRGRLAFVIWYWCANRNPHLEQLPPALGLLKNLFLLRIDGCDKKSLLNQISPWIRKCQPAKPLNRLFCVVFRILFLFWSYRALLPRSS